MAGDILGQYGPESNQPQPSVARKGGIMQGKDVMNYKPPWGPKNIMDPQTPGIHGANSGMDGSQGSTRDALQKGGSVDAMSTGSGKNHGCCGSQGRY